MCTVLAWNGNLPKGLLTGLLNHADVRGKDSTGLAWRDFELKKISVYKRAVSPRTFTDVCQSIVGDARRVTLGIGHTRRASPNMPIDSANAHPFVYRSAKPSVVYAHNGKIDNWISLRDGGLDDLLVAQGGSVDDMRKALTDSQVLGPCIVELDFERLVGCAGLVWLKSGGTAHCARFEKELTSVVLDWPSENGNVREKVTIVCSTADIIRKAIDSNKYLRGKGYGFAEQPLEANTCYQITQNGCIPESPIKVNPNNHGDAFTSGIDPLPDQKTA